MQNSEPCAQGGQANRHHPPKHRSCSCPVLFCPRSGLRKHGSGLAFPGLGLSGIRSPGSPQHPPPAPRSGKNGGCLPTSTLPLGARLLPLRKRGGWAVHRPSWSMWPALCLHPCGHPRPSPSRLCCAQRPPQSPGSGLRLGLAALCVPCDWLRLLSPSTPPGRCTPHWL